MGLICEMGLSSSLDQGIELSPRSFGVVTEALAWTFSFSHLLL